MAALLIRCTLMAAALALASADYKQWSIFISNACTASSAYATSVEQG